MRAATHVISNVAQIEIVKFNLDVLFKKFIFFKNAFIETIPILRIFISFGLFRVVVLTLSFGFKEI